MKCPECEGKLEVLRLCRKVLLRCGTCRREYQVHEVVGELDRETEKLLARYPAIIYD